METKKALFTECLFSESDIESLRGIGVEVIEGASSMGEEKLIEELQGCSIFIIGGLVI